MNPLTMVVSSVDKNGLSFTTMTLIKPREAKQKGK